ncbi:ARID DNA-binding domain-containing protein [Tanacetum coccineum]
MLKNGPWFIRNNPLILKKWHPDEKLLKEDVSTVPVWVKLHGVLVTGFSKDGFSAIATKLGTLLMLDSYTSDMCMQSWGRSSYARVMIELRADVELKDNIVMAMPKITREGHYACNVRVDAGEKKTVKKPSQTSRGVPVGPKMGFKPQKEYRPITKMPNASSNGNKKKGVEPTIEVSNSNPFNVLNSIDNDVEFGTNGGTTNLVNNEATSSGSSFMNIDNDGEFTCNTPIESNSEVEVVFDETANLRISTSGKDGSDKGYGTNSLLEQWRDSYLNNDDYDPYDDDMYENHDLSEHLQSIYSLKAKIGILCVSCKKNVLTPCHGKCLAKYKLSVKSNVRRALFTTLRIAKTKSVDTTLVVATTRPIRVESINGRKYIMVIVDYYSRYMWVYFLRTKDEAPDMIMKFIAQFDEFTTMAFEHINLELETNRFNVEDSSAESNETPSKADLDYLFSLIYEEYFEKRYPKCPLIPLHQQLLIMKTHLRRRQSSLKKLLP